MLENEERAHQQKAGIFHEGGSVAFDSMSDELKNPSTDEESQAPLPIEENHHQGCHDGRNPDDMRGMIHGVFVISMVAVYPALHCSGVLGRDLS